MHFLRLLWILLVLAAGVVIAFFSWALPRPLFFRLTRSLHRSLYRAAGIRADYCGDDCLQPGTLIVSNHISWLDIHLIGARWPVVFLAKSSVRRWPVIGWLAARSGTLFIERGSGANKAVKEIGDSLQSGQSVVLFPEGRTSDGNSVGRFHARLFQAVLDNSSPLRPLALRYLTVGGEHDQRASFAGDVNLLQSLWRVLRGGRIHAEIILFDPLPRDLNRQQAAAMAEDRVRAVVAPGTA
ncbi:MAG: lysophospholipid acyltransferase family protein [Pseudomonadota bacterium]|nr:lysophospholipid acyltransferase family protein [Pseudomonadota bacterium]